MSAPATTSRAVVWRRPSVIPGFGLTLGFTFVEGVWISPLLYLAQQQSPGIVGQTAVLTGSTFGVLTA